MKLTHEWVNKQIEDYKKMITGLDMNDSSDRKLNTIWSERVNTLESVLKVIELEMTIY